MLLPDNCRYDIGTQELAVGVSSNSSSAFYKIYSFIEDT